MSAVASGTVEGARVAHFEDFWVGQSFASPQARTVTQADLEAFASVSGDHHPLHTDVDYSAGTRFGRPVMHGPYGLAAFFGYLHEQRVAQESVEALLDTNWRYLAPVYVGDALSFHMTITGCRRTSAGDCGVVNRHVSVTNQHGVVVQAGTTSVLVRARGDAAGRNDVGRAFCTTKWARELGHRLEADSTFTAATASWDGTIGLRCGESEVQVRIYRGRVLEAVTRTPHGPSFTLVASELTWTQLMTGPCNDFVRRTMNGEFQVSGSAYEYLRLTKAVVASLDCARTLAQEDSPQ